MNELVPEKHLNVLETICEAMGAVDEKAVGKAMSRFTQVQVVNALTGGIDKRDRDGRELAKELGLDPDEVSKSEVMIAGLSRRAMAGDVKAFKALQDYAQAGVAKEVGAGVAEAGAPRMVINIQGMNEEKTIEVSSEVVVDNVENVQNDKK